MHICKQLMECRVWSCDGLLFKKTLCWCRAQSTHRVTITTGAHSIMMKKFAQPRDGRGVHAPPFSISTIMYKVVMYTPAERAGTLPLFSTVLLYALCGIMHICNYYLLTYTLSYARNKLYRSTTKFTHCTYEWHLDKLYMCNFHLTLPVHRHAFLQTN